MDKSKIQLIKRRDELEKEKMKLMPTAKEVDFVDITDGPALTSEKSQRIKKIESEIAEINRKLNEANSGVYHVGG